MRGQLEPVLEEILQHEIQGTGRLAWRHARDVAAFGLRDVSYRAVSIQSGPSTICDRWTPYACRIKSQSGTLTALNRPPGWIPSMTLPSSAVFGRTDATSNFGLSFGVAGACTRRKRGA